MYSLVSRYLLIATKHVFSLTEIDQKSTDLAAEKDELNKILQASVPGLVSKSQRRSMDNYDLSSTHRNGFAAGHKLLATPGIFNISVLLPPSLSFLQRLKDIVPSDSDIAISTLTSFLDDFLLNVFHPQFEETVVDMGRQSYSDHDAFEEDNKPTQQPAKPRFK